MNSTERGGDALAAWLDAAGQDARAARSYPPLDRSDAAYEAGRRFRQRFMHEELMLAVLAVVQAGPALVFEQQRLIMMLMRPLAEQDDMAVGEQIDVVTELATKHRAALAALRALVAEDAVGHAN